jgi:hypothetical protein
VTYLVADWRISNIPTEVDDVWCLLWLPACPACSEMISRPMVWDSGGPVFRVYGSPVCGWPVGGAAMWSSVRVRQQAPPSPPSCINMTPLRVSACDIF